jgi:pilus assembly protein CpaE
VAIRVTLVGALDKTLDDRLRAAGMRTTSIGPSDLSVLAHPSTSPPDVVVLDLRAETQIPTAFGLIKRQHPGTGLIVVASALDPALMLEAMRSGVTECVTEIGRGDLEAAVNRLVSQRSTPTAAGEVFAFLGAKGGVGTTTVAVNVAAALSTIASTLLIDMHIAGGDASLYLGADPGFSVIDALENTHRLDAAYFRGLVARTKSGPDLLASADRAVTTPLDPPRIRMLIDFASHHYRYTVLDIPRSDAAVLDSLETSARIVVVANQELATIRGAGRVASMLRHRYGIDKVGVVLSRSDRRAEIGMEDLKRAVGGSVMYEFPSDYRLALDALNKGQPIVLEGKSPLAIALQSFGYELAGVKGKAESKPKDSGGGLFGRLTGRRG